MGVLVGLSENAPAVLEAGRDIAMQIAAMNPVAVDPDSVPLQVVAREKSIVTEQIKNDPKMAGKPDEMIDKVTDDKTPTLLSKKIPSLPSLLSRTLPRQ